MGDSGQSDSITGGITATPVSRVPNSMEDLAAGMMVGEYQIEGLLGEGGMGRVYSATHPVIAKRAAIKILHPELSVNREAVERFVQEARSVNQIGHPNIVDIFAFGALPDGRSYFVMEWLRGESLRDRLRKGPLPIGAALAVIETITIALEAAHEKGVVHRDLKPDNIFLVDVKGTSPTVKLLDFGIAKLLGEDAGRIEKTATGNLLGTPGYISPEQARGQHVDHRTDIYALGALLYELLTGWLPFPADSAADMIAKHLLQDPPFAREKNPNVPPELERLTVDMLAKDPKQRPTLDQVRRTIEPFRHASAFPRLSMPTPAQYTPSTATGHPFPTPLQQTGMPGASPVGMTTHLEVAAPRRKLPLILGALLLVGGAAAAVVVGTQRTPAALQVAPAVKLDPVKPVEARPEEVKPVEVKPVEVTPVEAVTPEPDVAKPEAGKPDGAPPEATVETRPGKKAGGKKAGGKKAGGKKHGGAKATPIGDDEAW